MLMVTVMLMVYDAYGKDTESYNDTSDDRKRINTVIFANCFRKTVV